MTVALSTDKFLTVIFAVLLECHLMVRVNLYCIVTRKLKSYVKDFYLRVTMYYLHNIYNKLYKQNK